MRHLLPTVLLEDSLAHLGWKLHAIAIVAELIRQQAEQAEVRPDDLVIVRRLAVRYSNNHNERYQVGVRNRRGMMVLTIMRQGWRPATTGGPRSIAAETLR